MRSGIAAAALLAVIAGCGASAPHAPTSATATNSGAPSPSRAATASTPAPRAASPLPTGTLATSNGQPLPDHRLTPGAVLTTDLNRLCPHVDPTIEAARPDETIKNDVYAEYGITTRATGQYEIDHLIPLELGGANTISNLWPELNDHPAPGVLNTKDELENRLHTLVCDGQLSLPVAQQAIATNWYAAYLRYIGTAAPAPAPVQSTTVAPAPPPVQTTPPAAGVPVVHPGAFCAPAGIRGVTSAGTPMVCGPASDGRNRWHSG